MITVSSDEVRTWGTLVGVFLVAVVQQFALRRSRTAAEGVRQRLEKADNNQSEKLNAIHTLVNSSMGKQLRLTSVMARRIADLTNSAEDVRAAQQAEIDYAAYLERQSKFDEFTTKINTPGQSPSGDPNYAG